jgi:DUF1365 family protein
MRSCLYQCQLMHQRLHPARYALHHALFMLYLDLDEIGPLCRELRLLGHNRWNLYSFHDADHLPGAGTPGTALRARVLEYLSGEGIRLGPQACIRLLTLPRIAGYVFNPISVYFCFEEASAAPRCAIAEVGNTFGEHKLYLLPHPPSEPRAQAEASPALFTLRVPKHYYVSPFSSLTLQFDFRLREPGAGLDLRIDDYDGERRVLRSALRGQRRALTDARLAVYAVKYPLLTLKVIALIHWHAFRLWRRGLPWYRKADSPELQQGVLSPARQREALRVPR